MCQERPGAQRWFGVDAFAKALPHLPREDVIMRYYFMQAILAYLIADASKLELLSLKSLKSDDYAAALPHVVAFAIPGWLGSPTRR